MVEYTYDAWGNVLSITGMYADTLGVNNPIRYRGYYQDFETGFYYLQSRYYDPAVRRFINADGYINANGDFIGFNMYAYCGNNPVNRNDDGGEFWHIVAGAIIGGVSSFASSIVTGSSVEDALISAAFGAVSGGLCAAFPGASAIIGAGMSAAESVVIDVKNKEDTSTIVVDAVVSATFGAVSSSGDSFFTNKNTYDEVGTVAKTLKKLTSGNNPTVKKFAKKSVNKFFKKAGKNFISESIESIMTDAIQWGTNKYLNLILNE